MTPKISACLIVRNEAANIVQCLQSLRPFVDEIVVVDTGSVDETRQLALPLADKVELFIGCNDDAGNIRDFSLARNYAHSLATHDWVFWCDGDDVVHGAEHLRAMAAEADAAPRALYMFPYHYSFDEAGNPTCIHWRERLLKPNRDYRWQSPVHEVLMPVTPGAVQASRSSDVWIEHRRDRIGKAVDPERNLRILLDYTSRDEGKDDVRAWFYTGLELKKMGRFAEAKGWLTRYIERTGWADEKCIAQLELAQIGLVEGDWGFAIQWGNEARLTKSWADPYYVMGKAMYELAERQEDPELKRYELSRAAHNLQLGSNIHNAGQQDTVLFQNPQEFYVAQHFLAPCLANLGLYEAAIQSCQMGLKGMPNSEHLRHIASECQNKLDKNRVLGMCESMMRRGALSESAAMVIERALTGDFAVRYKAPPKPEAKPGCLDIVFYTGPAWEDWTPDTLKEGGLGGSETMCIELARRFAKRGHGVRVFGQPGTEGTFDGVQYLSHERWESGVDCDVLVASRAPWAVDAVQARLKLLWVHDVHCGPSLTRERALKFDWILALSEWHKQFLLRTYHLLDPDRVLVTRNGIDLAMFSGHEERNPCRAIYSSSPDRGLALALHCWPRIVEQVPEAELHVFYGFDNWEKAAASDPEEAQRLAEVRALLAAAPQVYYHGRQNPERLAVEFQRSGVWYYPTWFSETSCITAMQAQAAGCWPVTTALAALRETVKMGSMLDIEADGIEYGSQEHQDWIVERTVFAMTALHKTLNRNDLRDEVSEYGLDSLATKWQALFAERLAMVERNPVQQIVEWRRAG